MNEDAFTAGVRAALAAGSAQQAIETWAPAWTANHGAELTKDFPDYRNLEALERLRDIAGRFLAAAASAPYSADEATGGGMDDVRSLRAALERVLLSFGKDSLRSAIAKNPEYRRRVRARSLHDDIVAVTYLFQAADYAYRFPNRAPSRDVTAIRELLQLWRRMDLPTKPLALRSPMVVYIGRVLELLGSPVNAPEDIVRAIKDAMRAKKAARRRRAKADSERERASVLSAEWRAKEAMEEAEAEELETNGEVTGVNED